MLADFTSKPNAPILVGIVNLTPDSFSDGRPEATLSDQLALAQSLIADGAQILDVGGESTRPDAHSVTEEEEKSRVLPFLEAFRKVHPKFPISLDTKKIAVAKAALEYNYQIINDVSFCADPKLVELASDQDLYYILMHARGDSQTMMALTDYGANFFRTLRLELESRITDVFNLGLRQNRLILDLGFGFAKSMDQNHELMMNLEFWQDMDFPKMLGISRKRFLQRYTGENRPEERDEISAELAVLGFQSGFQLIRTHNVALTLRKLGLRLKNP